MSHRSAATFERAALSPSHDAFVSRPQKNAIRSLNGSLSSPSWQFFQDGWTPKHLLRANVYDEIAVALKDGAWRKAGLALLRKKLAERPGERLPVDVLEELGLEEPPAAATADTDANATAPKAAGVVSRFAERGKQLLAPTQLDQIFGGPTQRPSQLKREGTAAVLHDSSPDGCAKL